MSTDPRQERTLGQLVASASQDISTLIRGEIALAKAEVSGQVKKAGMGGGFLAAAAVVAFYAVYFIFTTLAEVIDIWLPRWASFLIITVLMLLIAALLAFMGIKKMKTVDPKPKKAIANAEQTIAAIKSATANPGTVTPAPRPEWDRPSSNGTTLGLPGSAPGSAPGSVPDPSRDA